MTGVAAFGAGFAVDFGAAAVGAGFAVDFGALSSRRSGHTVAVAVANGVVATALPTGMFVTLTRIGPFRSRTL